MANYKVYWKVELTYIEKNLLKDRIKEIIFNDLQWKSWGVDISSFINREITKFLESLEGKPN